MINKLPSGVKHGKGENPSKWRCIAGKIIELKSRIFRQAMFDEG